MEGRRGLKMKKSALVLIAMIVILPTALRADTAITLTSYGNFNNNTWTLGFLFTPTVDLNVTALGSYFPGGATTVHNAGIWDTAGNLIVGADVTGTGVEGFQFAAITPLILFAGTQYVVGANTLGDNYADIGATFTTGGFFSYDGHVETICGTAAACFPGLNVITYFDDFGANFQYAPVPEPGSMVLLGSGLLGVAGAIRRKFHA